MSALLAYEQLLNDERASAGRRRLGNGDSLALPLPLANVAGFSTACEIAVFCEVCTSSPSPSFRPLRFEWSPIRPDVEETWEQAGRTLSAERPEASSSFFSCQVAITWSNEALFFLYLPPRLGEAYKSKVVFKHTYFAMTARDDAWQNSIYESSPKCIE